MNGFLLAVLYSLKVSFSDMHRQRLLFAPAAGYRNYGAGTLTTVGTVTRCWTSSSLAVGSYFAGSLHCDAETVTALHPGYRAHAFSVRCVQHPPDSFLSK